MMNEFSENEAQDMVRRKRFIAVVQRREALFNDELQERRRKLLVSDCESEEEDESVVGVVFQTLNEVFLSRVVTEKLEKFTKIPIDS